MAATVHLLCPSCRFVVAYLTDPDAISNTTRVDDVLCPKCQDADDEQRWFGTHIRRTWRELTTGR